MKSLCEVVLTSLLLVLLLDVWLTRAGPTSLFGDADDDVILPKQTTPLTASDVDVSNSTLPEDSQQLVLVRHRRSVERDNTDILQVKSLCSWSYVTDHDDNRIPADIQKAANCFNRVADQTLNDCYMIYFWSPVRTRLVTSGVVTWVDSWIRLPVGCTMANRIKMTPGPSTIVTPPYPIV